MLVLTGEGRAFCPGADLNHFTEGGTDERMGLAVLDADEDPEGPWKPAGPNWQRARNTDVVDGITAWTSTWPEHLRSKRR